MTVDEWKRLNRTMPLTVILFVHIINIGLTGSNGTTDMTDTDTCINYDPSLKDYKFVGCYDAFVPDYISDVFTIDGMTNDVCLQTCLQNGRRFAGIETNNQCRCTERTDTFEMNNLEYESMADCGLSSKSGLFHSDYILNTTVCGILGVELQDYCINLNKTTQCAKLCKHYPHFIILNDTITGEVSCGCSNESVSDIAAPIVVITSSSDDSPCSEDIYHLCYEFYGCYDPLPNNTFGFSKDNMTSKECFEFCMHIEKPLSGIEHRNHCRCADDPHPFLNTISYQSNCSLTKNATLYILSDYQITNQCNVTSFNCSGIVVTTNCSYLCQRFQNETNVPAVSYDSDRVMCDCSENVNTTISLPSADIENCIFTIMQIYDKKTFTLPTITTPLETISTTTEIPGASTVTAAYSSDAITHFVQETTNILAAETQTSVQGTTQCHCPCLPTSTKWDYLENLNLTRDQLVIYLEDELESLRQDISIDAKETSAFKNSKISAADSRQSSAAMGGLGVVLLTVIFGLIVLSDLAEFMRRRSWSP